MLCATPWWMSGSAASGLERKSFFFTDCCGMGTIHIIMIQNRILTERDLGQVSTIYDNRRTCISEIYCFDPR